MVGPLRDSDRRVIYKSVCASARRLAQGLDATTVDMSVNDACGVTPGCS